MAKCPHCRAEVPDGNICSSCGKTISRPEGIEVQYRDFKISEMLDIKISSSRTPRQEKVEPPSQAGQPVEADKRTGQGVKQEGKKASAILIAFIILFAAAAWYLLIRFLFRS